MIQVNNYNLKFYIILNKKKLINLRYNLINDQPVHPY